MHAVIIGDITPFSGVALKEKKERGHRAIAEVFAPLRNKDEILSAIQEYEDRKTPEARFAWQVDKLAAALQCRIYDEAGYINPNCQSIDIVRRHNLEMRGYDRLSDSWLEYCIESYNLDENFTSVARDAKNWTTNRKKPIA